MPKTSKPAREKSAAQSSTQSQLDVAAIDVGLWAALGDRCLQTSEAIDALLVVNTDALSSDSSHVRAYSELDYDLADGDRSLCNSIEWMAKQYPVFVPDEVALEASRRALEVGPAIERACYLAQCVRARLVHVAEHGINEEMYWQTGACGLQFNSATMRLRLPTDAHSTEPPRKVPGGAVAELLGRLLHTSPERPVSVPVLLESCGSNAVLYTHCSTIRHLLKGMGVELVRRAGQAHLRRVGGDAPPGPAKAISRKRRDRRPRKV